MPPSSPERRGPARRALSAVVSGVINTVVSVFQRVQAVGGALGAGAGGLSPDVDDDRSGGFEPLRFLPKGNKIVVVGVITSKSGTLESKDTVKRRLDEAAKFMPMEQMALSPQCGFASTEEGNVLSEEQQWAKMREVVEIAEEVWGK